MSLEQLTDFCEKYNIPYLINEPLSSRTTFAIGGPAALFAEPVGEKQAMELVAGACRLGVKYFVLGNGSNVLFPDEGYDGLVIYIRQGFTEIRMLDAETIECGSGASLKALTQFALQQSLTGLEFAYGIPGSVGGAVYMNAGAYGGEIKDSLIGASHIGNTGKLSSFTDDELGLSYRHSVYSDGSYIITKARFRLELGNYNEIKGKMDDFLGRRREKQPLDMPSCGSTFKRPAAGYASALIDECGLKGKKIGGAMVSEKHAGFIVNAGGAACKDVLDLIDFIQKTVKEKKGIDLTPEVRIIK